MSWVVWRGGDRFGNEVSVAAVALTKTRVSSCIQLSIALSEHVTNCHVLGLEIVLQITKVWCVP